MTIKKMMIEGLRGFSELREFNFAIPDKKNPGSGLTVLVGPNNSGKSTIIEAMHILNSNNNSIPKESRNILTRNSLRIEVTDAVGNTYTVKSTPNGGSYVERVYNGIKIDEYQNQFNAFILSNKRNFSSTFGDNGEQLRPFYKGNVASNSYRSNNTNSNFGGRLLKIFKSSKKEFNECLAKILYPVPNWVIESSNENQMYLEFEFGRTSHSSSGAGDGFINIFNIVDALYDSNEDDVIVIDEPEVSLHPDLQRKLFELLIEYSKDKQIIISTHSPYFVNWGLFSTYSKIIRLRKEEEIINSYELSETSKSNIRKLLKDNHNVHLLSLTANEVFFLNDNIILVEGQDDVIGYKKIFKCKKVFFNASFFGWGLGGAGNAKSVLGILKDLGYKKVFTIFDGNKKSSISNLKKVFPGYSFFAIEANDIRDKNQNSSVQKLIEDISKLDFDRAKINEIIALIEKRFPSEKGILKNLNNCDINSEYNKTIDKLIDNITMYFGRNKNCNTLVIRDRKVKNNDQDLADVLLNEYLKNNKLCKKIQKKYSYIKFNNGSGSIVSKKKIGNSKFYIIIEETTGLDEKHFITVQYHFIVFTKSNNVVLKKQEELENTLPKRCY